MRVIGNYAEELGARIVWECNGSYYEAAYQEMSQTAYFLIGSRVFWTPDDQCFRTDWHFFRTSFNVTEEKWDRIVSNPEAAFAAFIL